MVWLFKMDKHFETQKVAKKTYLCGIEGGEFFLLSLGTKLELIEKYKILKVFI